MKKTCFDAHFDRIVLVLLLILLLSVIYPLYFVVIASVSNPSAVSMGRVVLLPKGFSLAGYQKVIEYEKIWIGYRNTLFYVVAGTSIDLAVTLACAYPLSRKTLPGRGIVMGMMTFTMPLCLRAIRLSR